MPSVGRGTCQRWRTCPEHGITIDAVSRSAKGLGHTNHVMSNFQECLAAVAFDGFNQIELPPLCWWQVPQSPAESRIGRPTQVPTQH